MIALWHSVTTRRSTYVEEFLLLGGDFCIFGACGAIRLYLGASLCIYIFGFWCILCFDWVIHDKERYIDCICFLFHIAYLFIFMRLFMIYVFILCYVKSISYLSFTCILHTCVYAFVECFRKYTGWFRHATVYTYNW